MLASSVKSVCTGVPDGKNGKPWLQKLVNYLDRINPGKLSGDEDLPHAIHFLFNGRIDVDLLISPFWRQPGDFYEFLQRIPQSKRFK